MYTGLYCILYISPPSNLSGLSCQTQDPATNWNALSLCDGCFPIPPPCPAGSAVPIPSQYHIKRLTPAPAPLLLLTIALLFDKENFLQIPLKIGKQQLSRHRQAMGEERERMSEVGPKTGIRHQTSDQSLSTAGWGWQRVDWCYSWSLETWGLARVESWGQISQSWGRDWSPVTRYTGEMGPDTQLTPHTKKIRNR